MYRLKCECCGRFISDKDYDSGKLKSESIYTYEPIPDLWDVVYWCLKCTKLEEVKSQGEVNE